MDKEILCKLEPHLPTIFRCISDGFAEAMDFVESSSIYLGKTAISNIVNDFIRNRVKASFPSDSFVTIGRRLKVLSIDGIILRFKKLNDKHLAGNIGTLQAKRFAGQQKLPGMKKAVNLNAGWVLDPTGKKITTVLLTYPETMAGNFWSLDVPAFLADNKSIYHPPIVQALLDVSENTAVDTALVSVKPAAQKIRIRKKVQNE